MKTGKIIAILATVLIAGMSSYAGIDGSPHDFVGQAWYDGGDQLCAPCHAPHGTTLETIPLWNHADSGNVGSFTLYDSPSLQASLTDPTGSSLACLSCHDGSVAVDADSLITDIDATAQVGAGGDLSHEHPVSFPYAAVATADAGIKDATSAAGTGTIEDWLVGGSLECSSCHDPHNGPGVAKLLRLDNANSALCLTCHDK